MAKKLDRHVETIQRYLQNPKYRNMRSDIGKSRSATARDISHLKQCVLECSGFTSQASLNIFKTTRNNIIGNLLAGL